MYVNYKNILSRCSMTDIEMKRLNNNGQQISLDAKAGTTFSLQEYRKDND